MVGLGVTWYGLTRPYFFQKGERLNGDSYYNQLLPFYKKEGDGLFGHKKWSFQQDGASSHTDQKFKNGAKITSNSSFRKKDGHLIRQNLTYWIIPSGIASQITYNITK